MSYSDKAIWILKVASAPLFGIQISTCAHRIDRQPSSQISRHGAILATPNSISPCQNTTWTWLHVRIDDRQIKVKITWNCFANYFWDSTLASKHKLWNKCNKILHFFSHFFTFGSFVRSSSRINHQYYYIKLFFYELAQCLQNCVITSRFIDISKISLTDYLAVSAGNRSAQKNLNRQILSTSPPDAIWAAARPSKGQGRPIRKPSRWRYLFVNLGFPSKFWPASNNSTVWVVNTVWKTHLDYYDLGFYQYRRN